MIPHVIVNHTWQPLVNAEFNNKETGAYNYSRYNIDLTVFNETDFDTISQSRKLLANEMENKTILNTYMNVNMNCIGYSLTLNPTLIDNYMHTKVCDEITPLKFGRG